MEDKRGYIIAVLEKLYADFDPDDCIDWAYDAVETIERILQEEKIEDERHLP